MGYRQAVKAKDFDSFILGSNPSSLANQSGCMHPLFSL